MRVQVGGKKCLVGDEEFLIKFALGWIYRRSKRFDN